MEENISRIKSYFKILPSLDFDNNLFKIDLIKKTIHVLSNQKRYLPKPMSYYCFPSDGIFLYESQEDIFNNVLKDLVPVVIKQKLDLVFICYGRSGSGKSFTTTGAQNNYKNRGISLRLISQLFEIKRSSQTLEIKIGLSFADFYKNKFTDLLNTKHQKIFQKKVKINNYNYAFRKEVKSEDEAIKMILLGESLRKQEQIDEGDFSYSSHFGTSIITVHLNVISRVDSNAIINHSAIYLIEMAGYGLGRNDANISKLFFDEAKTSLNLRKFTLFKQSSSIILKYLESAFNSNTKIRCVGHITGKASDIRGTITTLKFGMVNRKALEEFLDPLKYEQFYRRRLSLYNDDLNIFNTKLLPSNLDICNLSVTRYEQIRRIVTYYLNSQIDVTSVISSCPTPFILDLIEEDMSKEINNKKSIYEVEEEQEVEGEFSIASSLSTESIEMNESPDYVGTMQLKGFSIGLKNNVPIDFQEYLTQEEKLKLIKIPIRKIPVTIDENEKFGTRDEDWNEFCQIGGFTVDELQKDIEKLQEITVQAESDYNEACALKINISREIHNLANEMSKPLLSPSEYIEMCKNYMQDNNFLENRQCLRLIFEKCSNLKEAKKKVKEYKYKLNICKQRLAGAQDKIKRLFQEYYLVVNKSILPNKIKNFNTKKAKEIEYKKQMFFEKMQKKF